MSARSPWKACDIRGIFPEEVSTDLFYSVGRAVGSSLVPASRVLVAGDVRLSTPELQASLIDGVLSSGTDVLDAGQTPTPVAYFAHHYWKTDAVLIVTASHNPPDHNGLKMMIGELPPTEEDWMNVRRSTTTGKPGKCRGTRSYVDAEEPYLEWMRRRWRSLHGSLFVVLDPGNGAWSRIAPGIFESLGFRVERLSCEVDGSFPSRPPDCARDQNLGAVLEMVRQMGADMGFAWDGDGDRLAVVGPDGQIVTADELSVLFSRHVLREQSAQRIVCDIKLSDCVRKAVLELGGTPILEKSGHAFIKRRMIESDCVFGCELSGHYFHQELRGGDDGLFSALRVSEMIQDLGGMRKARQCIPPMYITPDLRLAMEWASKDALISCLHDAVRPTRLLTLDGIRMENADGFVLVRQSVTEPLVTMRIEGRNEERLQRLISLCADCLPGTARSQLKEQIGYRSRLCF